VDLFTLSAKLQLDKSNYEQGLRDSESMASKTGGAISGVLGASAKIAAAGIVATTTAIGGLVKSSVDAYADYEQLVGGVETLFGTGGKSLEEYAQSVGKTVNEVREEYTMMQEAQSEVLAYADNAYKNAGLSANEYMETVTSMAAALKQSLGGDTWAAADKADKAITDMSDNANKMGTSMEAIQNAYAGFTKQNYTMLDNLKLGYGGTRDEMMRLLDDASKISGIKYDISSYADIVDAIHVVQTEMGITGTTAKEASTTISGSLAMTKSAWENLVAGITNPDADISVLIDNLVDSAKTAASNLVPAVKQALTGVASLVQEIAPIISDELPSLVNDVLPMLIDTGISLFNGLVDALPAILDVLVQQAPKIINTIVDAIIDLLPVIIKLGLDLVLALAKGLVEALPRLIPAITEMITGLVEMLTQPDTLVPLVMAAVQIMAAIAMGLIQALPILIESIPQIIENVATTLLTLAPQVSEAAWELFLNLVVGLLKAVPELLAQVPIIIVGLLNAFAKGAAQLVKSGKQLVDNVYNGFKEKVANAKQWGKDLIQNFIDGVLAKWNELKQTVSNIAQSIRDYLGFSEPKLGPLSNFHTYAPDMMDLFIKGVNDNKGRLVDTVANAFDFENAIVRPYDIDVNGTSAGNTSGGNVYNININQPVDTADNLARVIREEAQYGLIGGVGFGY